MYHPNSVGSGGTILEFFPRNSVRLPCVFATVGSERSPGTKSCLLLKLNSIYTVCPVSFTIHSLSVSRGHSTKNHWKKIKMKKGNSSNTYKPTALGMEADVLVSLQALVYIELAAAEQTKQKKCTARYMG